MHPAHKSPLVLSLFPSPFCLPATALHHIFYFHPKLSDNSQERWSCVAQSEHVPYVVSVPCTSVSVPFSPAAGFTSGVPPPRQTSVTAEKVCACESVCLFVCLCAPCVCCLCACSSVLACMCVSSVHIPHVRRSVRSLSQVGSCSIQLAEKHVLLGSVPLNFTTIRTTVLRNTGQNHAYFQVGDLIGNTT